MFSSRMQKVASRKQAARQAAIEAADVSSVSEEAEILSAKASQIVQSIREGKWTAVEVMNAYISRAAKAQDHCNCLTEIMFQDALVKAKELDEEYSSSKTLRGPLHGIPISVKDQYEVEGVDASIGFSEWTNKPSSRTSEFVSQLIQAGAIPFCKTNVPQTMFAFECSNPVFGCTSNPHNSAYTAGGSSGGEAALLAMDGSAIGIGSDVGGSLRIPTSYCGIYAFKPAFGRISSAGAKAPVPGAQAIPCVYGPMGRNVEDLELVCRVSFGKGKEDANVAPLPFRETVIPSKLRFGYYLSDGFAKASPACQRAVIETVKALEKQGHECIEFVPPKVPTALNTYVALSTADDLKTLFGHLGPDKKEASLWLLSLGVNTPHFLTVITAWLLKLFTGDKIFAEFLKTAGKKSVNAYWGWVAQKDKYEKLFKEKVWDELRLDGIICPVQAIPQLPHNGCRTLIPLCASTCLYNLVDSPAGTIPVTRVDSEKDRYTDEWLQGPGRGSSVLEYLIYNGLAGEPVYDAEKMAGMPVGIQLVGKRWEEEKVIAMMKVVDDALGERTFGPGSWDILHSDK